MYLIKRSPILYLFFFVFTSLAIRLFYSFSAQYLPYAVIVNIAMVNTFLVVALVLYKRPPLFIMNSKIVNSLAPSLLIVLGSLLLCFISSGRLEINRSVDLNTDMLLLTVLLIPVVEELLYRHYLACVTRDHKSRLWSMYLSGLFFCMNHCLINFESFLDNLLVFPLGPFLMGVICEALVLYSESVLGAIAFHSVCNLTVYLFLVYDSRWLEWLSYLYLSGK